MQNKNRSAIVISALLTTLIMTLTAGGLLAYNGLLPLPGVNAQGNASQMLQKEAPIVVTVQPVLVPEMEQAAQEAPVEAASVEIAPVAAATVNSEAMAIQVADAVMAQSAADAEVIAAYQSQLEEAYRALQEAYVQIDALQTAQAQSASAPAYSDDDDDDGRSVFHFSDDSREGGEREHGDD